MSKNVDAFDVVGGVPGKLIRTRCPSAVAVALLEIAWWEWPRERIARNREFFEADINTISPEALRDLVQ